ncbi:MAG: fumarate hydratase [Eubacteriales bacterium]|nr:fumarate hydratase [Eubacteriales bacterium]
MKEITADQIAEAVEKLCIDANCKLNNDLFSAIEKACCDEESDTGRLVLGQIRENALIASDNCVPICQDTGMAVVFVELGQEVHINGGNLEQAINEGVRRGYTKGYLRKSVVKDPLLRGNTGDNTPAVIHYSVTDGDRLKIAVAPKGFGSENMSALKMLKPSDGIDGVKSFIIDTVEKAGPNPCPPIIVGVGLGGTMEKAALLSKIALLRPLGKRNSAPHLGELETVLLDEVNKLGIGPAGLGGSITALAVNIEVYPTHIAGLPVAVNIGCHATRHAEIEL